jgi:hypothetical protein
MMMMMMSRRRKKNDKRAGEWLVVVVVGNCVTTWPIEQVAASLRCVFVIGCHIHDYPTPPMSVVAT